MQASALAPTRTRQKTSFPSRATKWSQMEDEHLIKIMKENPKVNWNEIAPQFPGKTAQQISERWSKVVNPDLVKGSWTRQEDEVIIDFVSKCGTKNWTKLAALLPGRIGKQCRERWRNHLDPSNNHGAWTPEEDNLLIKYHAQYGNSWVKIAQLIPGRSDNSIKNRWNSTLKKYPAPVVNCKHSTPVDDLQEVAIPPQTPSTVDPMPRPIITDVIEQVDQSPSVITPRGFDIISPFALRSPSQLASPFYKTESLLSPWGDSSRSPSSSLLSPRFSINNSPFEGSRSELSSLIMDN